MIRKPTLKYLINRYLKDSSVLIDNKRYASTLYLSGYSVELALKYCMCRIMKFSDGFPETISELNSYLSDTENEILRSAIRKLRDIRTHDLHRLLLYSGEENNIMQHFFAEWSNIKIWNPMIRYQDSKINKLEAERFLRSAKIIFENIIL